MDLHSTVMQAAIFGLGTGGIILILVLLIILIGAKKLPELFEGLKRGIKEFSKATHEVTDEIDRAVWGEGVNTTRRSNNFTADLILLIAQGFGSGRIPWAPGTFGSLVGLLWFAVLLAGGNLWLYLAGCAVGIFASVRFCAAAEKIMKEKDPSSVVLDEIIALPICFLSWIFIIYLKVGYLPEPGYFFSARTWPMTAMVYVLFRLFDIAKPWPVRQSQSLPGGWGVTIDDVLAAVYVNLVMLAVHGVSPLLEHKP